MLDAQRFAASKGTYDVVPPASATFRAVVETLSGAPRRSGYGYIETPIFEDTALFARGVGESTDIVTKEMYTFTDKGGRSLTLRPEGTAGVLRAVVEHGLERGQLPVKLWYTGPNFRYERPQSGRYRQHVQVGVETVGSDDPALDAEVIWLAWSGFVALGLTRLTLNVNSLGCQECRPAYRSLLQEFLAGLELDADTRRRAEVNPLRVLDDKRAEVREQLTDAPLLINHLCAVCREHHDEVRSYLTDLGVRFRDDPMLVRGMDYYNRTIFEFVHDGLGAQASIGGGGRYDGLLATVGGPDLGGIGFGLGVDRTVLALAAEGVEPVPLARCDVFVVPLGAQARRSAVRLLAELRQAGVRSDLAYGGRGLKGAMKGADRSGAQLTVVLGERDLEAEGGPVAQLKDMSTGEQVAVALTELVATVTGTLMREKP